MPAFSCQTLLPPEPCVGENLNPWSNHSYRGVSALPGCQRSFLPVGTAFRFRAGFRKRAQQGGSVTSRTRTGGITRS